MFLTKHYAEGIYAEILIKSLLMFDWVIILLVAYMALLRPLPFFLKHPVYKLLLCNEEKRKHYIWDS